MPAQPDKHKLLLIFSFSLIFPDEKKKKGSLIIPIATEQVSETMLIYSCKDTTSDKAAVKGFFVCLLDDSRVPPSQ